MPCIFPAISQIPSLQPIRTVSFFSLSLKTALKTPKRDFRIFSDDGDAGGDADGGGDGDADGGGEADRDAMDEEEADESDNKRDYDVEYEALVAASRGGGEDGISMAQSKNFVSTQGWNSEVVVDYRINEDEFHKISLMDCDFFIRKPPDPDNDVYDFREMYVTEPDTDIYAIPRVLTPMPEKYIRCAKSDWGTYNVTEPPIDALRDPIYKSEWEVMKNECYCGCGSPESTRVVQIWRDYSDGCVFTPQSATGTYKRKTAYHFKWHLFLFAFNAIKACSTI